MQTVQKGRVQLQAVIEPLAADEAGEEHPLDDGYEALYDLAEPADPAVFDQDDS